MATQFLSVLFDSRTDAEQALARLREMGLAGPDGRIVDQPGASHESAAHAAASHGSWLLCTRIREEDAGRVPDVLEASHAVHVLRRFEADEWLARQRMRLPDWHETGDGIAPSEGDAETGTTAPSGR